MGDPALAVATPMIKLLLEKTSSLVKEELLSFMGIDKDVEHLSSNLTSIQAVLQDAEEKQRKSAEIRVWLQKLQNAAYDAVDILDLYAAELYAWKRKQQQRKFQRPFSLTKASFQNKAAKDIKEVKAKIDMIAEEKKKFHLNASSQHSMDPPETSFVLPPEDIDHLSLPLLHSRLLEFLPGTRFLLVLDDVWTEKYEDWDSIKQFLRQGKKGSRVLVTSRSSRVAEIMGTLPPHRLEDLPQDECWSLPLKGFRTNLHTYHVGRIDDGRGIRELQGLNHLTGSMQISLLENAENAYEANLTDKASLNRLVLEWGDNTQDEASAEIKLENLKPHSNIEEVQICGYKGMRFPSWLGNGVYQNLVSISLKQCTKCRVLSLNHLPRLTQLSIKGMLELEEWPDRILPNLRRLKISDCPKLRDLPPLFPNLGVLKIKRCNSLKALPVALSLQFLILIENDDLENWHNKAVHVHLRNEQDQEICMDEYCLMGVLELTIYRCPKIQALPQVFAPQKLEISGCELLNALPAPQYARRFQHLALDSCPDTTLVKAIPETGTLYSLVISNISKMLSLPKWPNLPGLKALYIRDCNDLISLFEDPEGSLQGLASVKLLSIQGCPKLVSLPEAGLPSAIECLSIGSCSSLETLGHKEALKRLTCLKDVNLENCSALESLPEEGLPDSIKHLRIQGCTLLKQRCKNGGADWSKIMHVPDLEIDSIGSGVSSANQPSSSKARQPWLRMCREIDMREVEQPQHVSRAVSGCVKGKKCMDALLLVR
ncbi:Rx, N-terminal [Dillenia turbinata]|uniref:Rx, N-terminal n=1 Tax=Dillenia turbinata TaxID=194707 RepID=A0AAN8YYR1_9MAGN